MISLNVDVDVASLLGPGCSQRFVASLLAPPPLTSVNNTSSALTSVSSLVFVGVAPTEAKVWVDRDDIDFSNAEDLPPAQTLSLVDPDQHLSFGAGSLDYPLRASKFQAASSLTFFFPDR